MPATLAPEQRTDHAAGGQQPATAARPPPGSASAAPQHLKTAQRRPALRLVERGSARSWRQRPAGAPLSRGVLRASRGGLRPARALRARPSRPWHRRPRLLSRSSSKVRGSSILPPASSAVAGRLARGRQSSPRADMARARRAASPMPTGMRITLGHLRACRTAPRSILPAAWLALLRATTGGCDRLGQGRPDRRRQGRRPGCPGPPGAAAGSRSFGIRAGAPHVPRCAFDAYCGRCSAYQAALSRLYLGQTLARRHVRRALQLRFLRLCRSACDSSNASDAHAAASTRRRRLSGC